MIPNSLSYLLENEEQYQQGGFNLIPNSLSYLLKNCMADSWGITNEILRVKGFLRHKLKCREKDEFILGYMVHPADLLSLLNDSL